MFNIHDRYYSDISHANVMVVLTGEQIHLFTTHCLRTGSNQNQLRFSDYLQAYISVIE